MGRTSRQYVGSAPAAGAHHKGTKDTKEQTKEAEIKSENGRRFTGHTAFFAFYRSSVLSWCPSCLCGES
jgi:hypothetical protein